MLAIAAAIDYAIVTADEQKEKNVELRESFNTLNSELEDISSEIRTIGDRIEELESMDKLSLTEQGELNRLREENKELEYRKELLEAESKMSSTKLNSGIEDWWKKEFNTERSHYSTFDEFKGYYVDGTTGTNYGQSGEITREEQFKKQIARAKELIALGENRTHQEEEELRLIKEATSETATQISEQIKGYKAVTQEEINRKKIWEGYIKDAAYVQDPYKHKEVVFDEIWNSSSFRKQRSELIESVGKDGKLDASILSSNEKYKILLDETGYSAEILANHIEYLVEKMRQQSSSAQDFATQFKNLPIDLLEDYIAIANADGFTTENIGDYKELQQILESTGMSAEKANEAIKEIAESSRFISAVDLTTKIQESYDVLEATKKEFKETKAISLDCLNTIAKQYPELNSAIAKYSQGLITADDLIKEMEESYQDDVDAYHKGMVAKLSTDETFWTNVIENNKDFFEDLAEAYKQDIKNYTSLAKTKAEIDAELIKKLAVGWGEYYRVVFDAAGKASGVDFVGDESVDLVTSAQHKEYINKANGAFAEYNKVIDQLNKIAEDAIVDPDFNFNIDKDKNGSGGSSSDEYKETFDFFERRINVLTQAFDNLGSTMENVLGAKAKNTLLSGQADILTSEINDYTKAIAMYSTKADESLAGLDDSLIYKIKNGVVELTDFTGANGEKVVEAMEKYKGWADKVEECKNKINELKKEIAQIELQKFNNIADQYTNRYDLYGNYIDIIDKQIGLLEESGELVGKEFYEEQKRLSESQLSTLEAQKKDLADQMAEALKSGNIEIGNEEWNDMVKTLSDVEGKILDSKTAIEKFDNAIQGIDWTTFDRVQERFDNLNDELENLISLFDDINDISVIDEDGNWTDEAITTLGLYAQQYELAQYRVKQYADAISDLQDDYAEGKYTATEYAEKLADLNSKQWDAVNSAEAAEDAIMSLNQARVDKEIESINDAIEAYREYTDSQIEALNAAKDLHDYEQSIAEKTKSVVKIEQQLAAMANDNSAATIAKRKQLEEELAEARKELEDAEYEHSVQSQIDALEKNYENYEEKRNQEIEALENSLKNQETIIAESFEIIKQNADIVGQEIADIADAHGVTISNVLVEAWDSGEDAIASYGQTLDTETSEFIQQLSSVEQKEYALQEQANTTYEAIANAFGCKADELVTEFDTATSKVNDMNTALTAVQNVLNSIAQNGIDTSAIVSSLEKVKDAAKSASAAIQDVGSDNSNKTEKSVKYKIVDAYSGEILAQNLDYSKAKQMVYTESDMIGKTMNIVRMAKGGIVGNKSSNLFEEYAKRIGEDRMIAVKDGEGILTKEQTQAFLKLVPTLNNFDKSWIKQPSIPDGFSSNKNNVSYNYDSILTVNGNIDDTNATKMTDLIRKELRSTFSKMDRDHRYSGY